jgi:predicted transcriptional regulator
MYRIMSNLTIRIPKTLREELKALSARQQRPTSEVVRDSLRRYIAAEKFRRLRGKTLPFAEAQGFLSDEDIFEAIS